MTIEEWVTLIGAVAAAIVSVFNARKLERVHKDTNGNLTAVKMQLQDYQRQIRIKP